MEMEYIYVDGDDYYFMDSQTYEQIALREDLLGDATLYLLPNIRVTVNFYENKPVSVELPQSVELKVTETEPVMKTATVTSSYKPAILETGLKTQVPPFISEGETIRIDTSDGKYLERAK
jgi:elongation factor P